MSQETLARALAHLDSRGLRSTQARQRILQLLSAENGPRSPRELHDSLEGDVPMSSLYRSLAVLESAGIVSKLHDGTGSARYELAEWLAGHHHHLTCLRCGATIDLGSVSDLEQHLADLIQEATGSLPYLITSHRLDLEGLCDKCQP